MGLQSGLVGLQSGCLHASQPVQLQHTSISESHGILAAPTNGKGDLRNLANRFCDKDLLQNFLHCV